VRIPVNFALGKAGIREMLPDSMLQVRVHSRGGGQPDRQDAMEFAKLLFKSMRDLRQKTFTTLADHDVQKLERQVLHLALENSVEDARFFIRMDEGAFEHKQEVPIGNGRAEAFEVLTDGIEFVLLTSQIEERFGVAGSNTVNGHRRLVHFQFIDQRLDVGLLLCILAEFFTQYFFGDIQSEGARVAAEFLHSVLFLLFDFEVGILE
jgi:hypothetical protein